MKTVEELEKEINDKKEEIDYFPIILIFLMMVICIINMCNYQSG